MTVAKSINGWTLAIILLVLIIFIGGVIIWSRYSQSQAIEISLVPEQELKGEIYIGGEVNNPGLLSTGGRGWR